MVIVELYQGSWALLDLHGPQNGPQNGSGEANSRGASIKKGPPGFFDSRVKRLVPPQKIQKMRSSEEQ